jgi:hypothetical protein
MRCQGLDAVGRGRWALLAQQNLGRAFTCAVGRVAQSCAGAAPSVPTVLRTAMIVKFRAATARLSGVLFTRDRQHVHRQQQML